MEEKNRIIKFESWIRQFCKTDYEQKCFDDWKEELKTEAQKEAYEFILTQLKCGTLIDKKDWNNLTNVIERKLGESNK